MITFPVCPDQTGLPGQYLHDWYDTFYCGVVSYPGLLIVYIRRGEKKQNQRVGSHLVCPLWHRSPAEQTDDVRVRVRLLTPLTATGWDFSTFMFCGFPFYATESWAHISNKSTCSCVWAGYKVHTGSVLSEGWWVILWLSCLVCVWGSSVLTSHHSSFTKSQTPRSPGVHRRTDEHSDALTTHSHKWRVSSCPKKQRQAFHCHCSLLAEAPAE